jgi:hypothetical protein
MSELKVGTKFQGRVEGIGDVECEVTELLPSQHGFSMSATAPVMGLQSDPPAHIARMAEKGIAILPSPVAPETNKSGIVPTGEVTFVGQDGFLHVVDAASS